MRALSTAASVVRHSVGAVGEALLIAAIIAALLLALAPVYEPADFLANVGSAEAARGGRGANSLAAASCSVEPGRLGLGEMYTATATGLPAGTTLNVKVSGGGSANLFMRAVDASGVASVSWYATWLGTNTVGFHTSDGRMQLLASCTFQVD